MRFLRPWPLLAVFLVFSGLLAFALPSKPGIRLSKVFTPHMVLQRDIPVPIWGEAAPGQKVTVRFRDQKKTATADASGKWRLTLDPLAAGGPDVLTVGDLSIGDVLVGEVWVGSGQSNMAMSVKSYRERDPALARLADQSYPKLRLLKSNANGWQQAAPHSIEGYSALLFAFGQKLQAELDVPVGLMVGAVGGTPSGFWLTEAMYRGDEDCAEAVRKFAPTHPYEELHRQYLADKAEYDEAHAEWKTLAEAAKAEGKEPPHAPKAPQPVGRAGEANSGRIGELFEAHIRPYVGHGIRGVLWDQGESQTNIAGVDQVTLMGALIRGWRQEWGQGDFPFLYVEKPSGGGCAWDPEDPETIQAEPFAPLPAAIPPAPRPEYCAETFTRIMRYPNTHMVPCTDLGGGIHPPNKSGYGARAGRVAMAVAYGKKQEWIGPLYERQEIADHRITLHFTHLGQGLAFRHGDRLQGFEIAGEDRRFVWAEAEIEGDTVVVSHAEIARPAAVRYAWSERFPWANLFNRDGLPAQPFRTDDW